MMVWYTDTEVNDARKEAFVSAFYEEGDVKVKVIDSTLLKETEDREIYYTKRDNLIYLER